MVTHAAMVDFSVFNLHLKKVLETNGDISWDYGDFLILMVNYLKWKAIFLVYMEFLYPLLVE